VSNNAAADCGGGFGYGVAQLHRTERGVPMELPVMQITPHCKDGATESGAVSGAKKPAGLKPRVWWVRRRVVCLSDYARPM
jgi:hypothetical protein